MWQCEFCESFCESASENGKRNPNAYKSSCENKDVTVDEIEKHYVNKQEGCPRFENGRFFDINNSEFVDE